MIAYNGRSGTAAWYDDDGDYLGTVYGATYATSGTETYSHGNHYTVTCYIDDVPATIHTARAYYKVHITKTVSLPAGYWAALELFKLTPHMVPAYFEKAPWKIEFKSKAPRFIHKKIKQPVSRSGFKRGQRR